MERLDNSKLSPVQRHIVNMISKENRLAIVGGPGTGKTVLAMSGMNKQNTQKQVLLTYSKPLSMMIQGCGVKAYTVHSFCWHFGKEIELRLKTYIREYQNVDNVDNEAFRAVISREYGYNKSKWPQWDHIYRDYLKLSPEAQYELRYNDIFIDEGQDLPNEAFIFFQKIADKIIVTYDDAQEVGRESDEAETTIIRKAGIECNRILSILGLQESFYDLIDNFRNTIAIEKVAKLFYNNYSCNALSLRVSENKRPYGDKPKVYFSAPTPAVIDKIADTTYQLNKQTGIIIPNRESFDKIKELFDSAVNRNIISANKFFYKNGNVNNMSGFDTNLNQTGVFLTTFQSSKGMEFDVVYIFDCQKVKLSSDGEKNQFYVAATRAKEKLSFYFDCNCNDSYPVLDVIKNNKELFDIEVKNV